MKAETLFGFGFIAIVIGLAAILMPPLADITDQHLGLLMLALVIVAIMLGFPAAFTLMGVGVMFSLYAFGGELGLTLNLIVQRAFATMSNDVLVAVPLFIFMGYIVERAALVERLFKALHLALAWMPGALAVATLATCALFATATGIVGAVVTVMGLLALPVMLRAGYSAQLATGAIAAGGCLGILIPPSILLIVYGATAGVSVVQLYAGALFPGLMLAGLYITYVVVLAKLRPSCAPPLSVSQRAAALEQLVPSAPVASTANPAPTRATRRRFGLTKLLITSFLPLAVLIAAVLGSILFGLATPTEAAAIGAAGGLLLAALYRGLSWSGFKESMFLTGKTTAMVGWLFVGSSIFSAAFALLGGQELIESWVLSLDLSAVQFMLLAQAIIFLLGWPLDWAEIIVIFVPIFLPLLDHFGIDPLFFGLLIALNLQTSYLSPPVAMAAFYLKAVAPATVRLRMIFTGMLPFIGLQIIAIALLYIFPAIGLWLPAQLYR